MQHIVVYNMHMAIHIKGELLLAILETFILKQGSIKKP